MNRQQRLFSQIISSLLTILLPLVLRLLGVEWIGAIAIGLIVGLAGLILTSSLSRRVQNFSTWIAYLLIAIATLLLILLGIPQIRENFQAPSLVYGYVGGERYELLVRNSKVKQLLVNANLQLTEGSVTKKGSISQLQLFQSDLNNTQPLDFLWTGDAPIAEGGKQLIEAMGKKVLENEATLSDPLILVVNQADAATLATNQFFASNNSTQSFDQDNFTYTVDTVKLVDFLLGDWTWRDIGLTQYASAPGVIMSDGRKSNGGVMAETLIGTICYNMSLSGLTNQAKLHTSAEIPQFQPLPNITPPEIARKMEQLRLRSGFAESTSSKIKVQLEEGGSPWALTYYSVGKQIVKNNPNYTLVALSHTIINSNQFLSFSENGTQLLKIIQSPEFQAIATEYGYDAPKGNWIVLPDPSFEAVRSLSSLQL
ncbi:MAG: hypothetical protein Tsb0014_41610 [Pleurocapsa sp.]